MKEMIDMLYKIALKEMKDKAIKIIKLTDGGEAIISENITIFQINDLPFIVDNENILAIADTLRQSERQKEKDQEKRGRIMSKADVVEPKGGIPSGWHMLPSGRDVYADRNNDEYKLFPTSNEFSVITLKGDDIARLYGISNPEKVHGKWNGGCGNDAQAVKGENHI